MAEYGDPDKPKEWKFLRRHSPYHLLRHDNLGVPEESGTADCAANPEWVCPKVLFTTSTRDDRVHPGHARKMVAKMKQMGIPGVHYYENVEGGHGGAADNLQRAYMTALAYAFLLKTVGASLEPPRHANGPPAGLSAGPSAVQPAVPPSAWLKWLAVAVGAVAVVAVCGARRGRP